MAIFDHQDNVEPMPSVLTVAHVVYALHTCAIVVGIAGAATVIGSFAGCAPRWTPLQSNTRRIRASSCALRETTEFQGFFGIGRRGADTPTP